MKDTNIMTGRKLYTNAKGEQRVFEGEYFPIDDCYKEAVMQGKEKLADGLVRLRERGWGGIIRGESVDKETVIYYPWSNMTLAGAIEALLWANLNYDDPEEIADALEDIDTRKGLLLMPEPTPPSFLQQAVAKFRESGKSEEENYNEYFKVIELGMNAYLEKIKKLIERIDFRDLPIAIIAMEQLTAQYKGVMPPEAKSFYNSLSADIIGIGIRRGIDK